MSLALVLGAAFGGCSFPDHTFIEDSQFYGTGAVGASSGSAGASGNGGSAGEGGGGTGGVGGTGGTPGAEDCLNGVDDDGDGKVDCEDPDCSGGYLCVPTPPSGWTGPIVYYEGSDTPPGCSESGGYPQIKQTASSGIDGGTATCPTCQCSAPTNSTCSAEIVFFDGNSCGGTGCWGGSPCGDPQNPPPAITVESTCKAQNLCSDATGAAPTSALFTKLQAAGTCTPSSSGQKSIPTPSFTKTVRACGDPPSSGTCPGGSGACLPKPTAPFSSNICIYQMGDVACPGGAWAKKTAFHLSFTDNRDCSACGCASATGTCTGASLQVFTDSACTEGQDTLSNPDMAGCTNLQSDTTPIPAPQCQNFAGVSRSMRLVGGTASGSSSCPTTGGQVTGAVAPTEPITFCCL